MSNATLDQTTEQFESLFFAPARTYATLTLDYTEKLMAAQFEAAKAYSDVGLSQARAALDIKDAEGLRSYVEGQQKVAQDISERLKDDAEKVAALNQEFVQKSQKLAEDNLKAASKSTAKAAK
ncbi:hypothetical protein GCM10007160_13940 [Litchfieldella qijiaojingensis]|uniref:Phasin domain-containing protein n=1 Tax=Litchfieldella qijiaojingensis TaxID=980347 RepID=A0ABQ2YP25_9GAMM|nr:phasin family protein [Halomonas qijiaojingensis]GGX87776.1 hypothetical protein GCM10007160_13940 [Halomonas qijiaojingensis]